MEWMFMPLKRYAEFSGRSRRMEFWMWMLFQFIIIFAFAIIMVGLVGSAAMSGDMSQAMAMGGIVLVLYLLLVLLGLAFFIPNLAVTIRRLHDTDRSGWWVMLYWGPYLLFFIAGSVIGAGAASGGQPTEGAAMAGGALGMVAGLAWLVGCIVLLVFMFLEGTPGPNRYGADPKGRGGDAQVFT
jgi:uncharacterized membrane protein YhaH (DUF805 family)